MNLVFEILNALAAVTTIAGFMLDVFREHRRHRRMTREKKKR